jgi:hypothetical protein
MSYRKISVDGTEYEYVIGKSNLKIKGIGVWPKSTVGVAHVNEDSEVTGYNVTPSIVKDLITNSVAQG